MNSMELKDKLKKISKKKNVDFNTLLRLYMYERFIERLSKSKYRDNFILKGGFYLSTLFGIENRFTMDIDTSFKNEDFTEEKIIEMIKGITLIELNDNVKISYLGIEPIRSEDEYGGFRVTLLVQLENIREKFHVDIATGDVITPKEIIYKYKPVLENGNITLWAYNIETVLAEKLETILSRLELNGRTRDFYDIYLIYTKDWENINKNHLKNAIKRTFVKRDFAGDYLKAFTIIKESELLKSRWIAYQKKYDYAKNILYDEIINCIETILKQVFL